MTAAAPLDLAFVRSQFPALADVTGPISTMPADRRCCKSVADRISDYLLTTSVQTGASYDRLAARPARWSRVARQRSRG